MTILDLEWLTFSQFAALHGYTNPLEGALVADLLGNAESDAIKIDSLGRRWDPRKHPRGRDGRFIEVGGLVKFFPSIGGRQVAGTGTVERITGDSIHVRVGTVDQHAPGATAYHVGDVAVFNKRQIATIPPGEVRLDRAGNVHPNDRELPDMHGKLVRAGDTVKVDGKAGKVTRVDDNSGRVVVRNDEGLHIMRRVENVERQDDPNPGAMRAHERARLDEGRGGDQVSGVHRPHPGGGEGRNRDSRLGPPPAAPEPAAPEPSAPSAPGDGGGTPPGTQRDSHGNEVPHGWTPHDDGRPGESWLSPDGNYKVKPTTVIGGEKLYTASYVGPNAERAAGGHSVRGRTWDEVQGRIELDRTNRNAPEGHFDHTDAAGNAVPAGWTHYTGGGFSRGSAYKGANGALITVTPAGNAMGGDRSWKDNYGLYYGEHHVQMGRADHWEHANWGSHFDSWHAAEARLADLKAHPPEGDRYRFPELTAPSPANADIHGNAIPNGWERQPGNGESYKNADGYTVSLRTNHLGDKVYELFSPNGDRWGEGHNWATVDSMIQDHRNFHQEARAARAEQHMPHRDQLHDVLGRNRFSPETIDTVRHGDAAAARVAIHADPAYTDLRARHSDAQMADHPNAQQRQVIEDFNKLESAVNGGIRGEPHPRSPEAPPEPPAPTPAPPPQRMPHAEQLVRNGIRDAGIPEHLQEGVYQDIRGGNPNTPLGIAFVLRNQEHNRAVRAREDLAFRNRRLGVWERAGRHEDVARMREQIPHFEQGVRDAEVRAQHADHALQEAIRNADGNGNAPNVLPHVRNLPVGRRVNAPDDAHFNAAVADQILTDLPPARGRHRALAQNDRYLNNLRYAMQDQLEGNGDARVPGGAVDQRINDYFNRAMGGRAPGDPTLQKLEDAKRRWNEMRAGHGSPSAVLPSSPSPDSPNTPDSGVDERGAAPAAPAQASPPLATWERELLRDVGRPVGTEENRNFRDRQNGARALARAGFPEHVQQGFERGAVNPHHIRAGQRYHNLRPVPRLNVDNHLDRVDRNEGLPPRQESPPTPPPPHVPTPAAPAVRQVRMQPGIRGQGNFANAVIRNRHGDDLKVGVIVRTNDGLEGYVARVHPPSNRVVIKNAQGVEVMRQADRVRAQYDNPNAPAPAAAPAAPAAPPLAEPVDAGASVLDRVQAIEAMHNQGAGRGFPLEAGVGRARQNIQAAIAAARNEDPEAFRSQLSAAILNYQEAQRDGIAHQGLATDVQRRLDAAKQLLDDFEAGLVHVGDPNVDRELGVNVANLLDMRRAIPNRIPANAPRTPGYIAYRNAGFAIDDALDRSRPIEVRREALARAERQLQRAVAGNVPGAQERLDTLRQIRGPAQGPGHVPGGVAPAQPMYVRPNVERPVVAEALNPNARGEDYAQQWGIERGDAIARAARERPSLQALTDAHGPDQMRLAAAAFDGEYGNTGMTAKVTSVSGGYDGLSVRGHIYDANGEDVGSFHRVVRSSGVYNSSMSINNDVQAGGYATEFNRHMEDWYIANGVPKVNVSAAGGGGYIGGFVWARNGFDWAPGTQGNANSIARSILREAQRGRNPDVVTEAEAMVTRTELPHSDPNFPTPFELSQVGWRPGLGRRNAWAGKTVMKSSNWSGEKKLDPNDRVYQQFVQAGRVPDPAIKQRPAVEQYGPAHVPDDLRAITLSQLMLTAPGKGDRGVIGNYDVRQTGGFDRADGAGDGVNITFILTARDGSGRRFIVKRDRLAGEPGVQNEVNFAQLMRDINFPGAAYVEAHPSDRNAIITTFVGEQNGLTGHTIIKDNTRRPAEIAGNLADPSTLITARLLNAITANGDRHRGNAMWAQDSEGKDHLLLFDHGLANIQWDDFQTSTNAMANNRLAYGPVLQEVMRGLGEGATTAMVQEKAQEILDKLHSMPITGDESRRQKMIDRLQEIINDPSAVYRITMGRQGFG